METTAKYLRFHTRELLEAARRGEEVIVTWRGKPQARLVAINDAPRTATRNPAYGMWRDRDIDVPTEIDRLRAPRQR